MGENAERLLRMATPPASDQQLLDLIIQSADDLAFTELVRRHGPMVLGVCRRVLNHEQDAEDAFQAAFLVLAKRASSLRNRQSLGSWLFGIARHVALRLRDKNRRRGRHENTGESVAADGSTDSATVESLALMEEELHRLPDKYKSPLITCYLHGRTQEDTAKEMRLSLSTLRRRLEEAREILRARLTRRGVSLPIGLTGLMSLTVAMPAGFAETTSRAALAFITGERGTTPAVLAQGVLAMMTQTKLKLITGAVLAIAIAGGLGYSTYGSSRADAGGQSGPADKNSSPDVVRTAGNQQDPKQKQVDDPFKQNNHNKSVDVVKMDDRIKPGDRLRILIKNGFTDAINDGVFTVEQSGKVALDPVYGGRIEIGGKTPEEVENILRGHLAKFLKNPLIQVTRYEPLNDDNRVAALEARVRVLETAVSKLSDEIAIPRKK